MTIRNLSPESEVLLRNTEVFASGHWLIINAADDVLYEHVGETRTVVHQYYDRYLDSQSQHDEKLAIHYCAFLEERNDTFDGAIIFWPKAKQHGVMLCQHVAALLKQSGTLLLVGDNKGGIKSAAKHLKQFNFSFNKLDNARHCTLLGWRKELNWNNDLSGNEHTKCPEPKAMAASSLLASSWRNSYSLSPSLVTASAETSNNSSASLPALRISTLPGTFSADSLDSGTALLLQDLPSLLDDLTSKNKVLDFACGNGVIASVIASQYPHLKIIGSDINALSLNCAEYDKKVNGEHYQAIAQIDYLASHGLSQVNHKFQVIISNPPFHTGTKTDYSITEQFIADAAEKLTKYGKLRIVANRFLKYPDILEQYFGNVTVIAQTSKFSVYQCIKTA